MNVKKLGLAALFVGVVSYGTLRLVVWGTGKMKASSNATVQKIGTVVAGG